MKTKVIMISLLSLFSTLCVADTTASTESDKLCINSRSWERITKPNQTPSELRCQDKFACHIAFKKGSEKQDGNTFANTTITITIDEKDMQGKFTPKVIYTCDKKSDLDENDPSICSTGVEEKMTCAYHFEKYYKSIHIE